MNMRKYYLLVLLFAVFALIVSSDVYSLQNENRIASEKVALELVELEVSEYRQYLDARSEILQLLEHGGTSEVLNRFDILAKEIEKGYLDTDYPTVSAKHLEMHFVYRDIELVSDVYRFYEALMHYLMGDVTTTRVNLEKVISDFPTSKKLRQSVYFLQAIYVFQSENKSYVDLYNKHTEFSTPKNRFWLAQAYYNLAMYPQAKNVINGLLKDEVYALRAGLLSNMIQYSEGDLKGAIAGIEALKDRHLQSERYYYVINISLARLYALSGKYETSLDYYDKFRKEYARLIGNDIIYEMGLVARDNGDTELAREYFSIIVDRSPSERLFDGSLSNLANIRASKKNTDEGMEILYNALGLNKSNKEALNAEVALMLELKHDIYQALYEPSLKNSAKFAQEISAKTDLFEDLNNKRDIEARDGLDDDILWEVRLINEEYIWLIRLMLRIEEVGELIAKRSNESKTKMMDDIAVFIDDLRVRSYILKMIGQDGLMMGSHDLQLTGPARYGILKEFSRDDIKTFESQYQQAKEYATTLVIRENSKELAIQKGDQSEVDRIDEAISELLTEIKQTFNEETVTEDYRSEVDEELIKLAIIKSDSVSLKDQVYHSYFDAVSRRVRKINESYYYALERASNYNEALYKGIKEGIVRMDQEYNFSLFSLLFQETLKKDRDYELLIEQFENETVREEGM
jgi:TolA-binding protein